jgi:hypothetical protein
VEYTVFIDKVPSGPIKCKDGVDRTFYINQWGMSSMVDEEKNLFESFTQLQAYNKESGKYENVLDESGDPIKLIYREANGGEVELYGLLHHLVTQDWFTADAETNLFIKPETLLRGVVKDITMYIGTETFQPVVGMMYVEAKDTKNGIQYNNNCIDGAWLPGWKIKDVNINTASNSWEKECGTRPKGKGSYKKKDIYEFYSAVRRCNHMYEFSPLHTFDPTVFVQAGNEKFISADNTDSKSEVSDMKY